MSRPTARTPKDPPPTMTGGAPVWVWIVYGLGVFAATVFLGSALFVLGAYLASDEVPVTFSASVIGIVVWGALIVLALGTLIVRRRGGFR